MPWPQTYWSVFDISHTSGRRAPWPPLRWLFLTSMGPLKNRLFVVLSIWKKHLPAADDYAADQSPDTAAIRVVPKEANGGSGWRKVPETSS